MNTTTDTTNTTTPRGYVNNSGERTAATLDGFPWIVSCDTLRPDHLADAYLATIDELGVTLADPWRSDLAQLRNGASDLIGESATEAQYWALSEAVRVLEAAAPMGFYFGASEGDGACFGFWLSDAWLECLEHTGVNCENNEAVYALIYSLWGNDVTTDNWDDYYQGTADGYSEERAGADYAQTLAEDTDVCDFRKLRWPLTCIDWEGAWCELAMGDGYWLEDVGGGDWLVFRSF
jgi:hypothetical protein